MAFTTTTADLGNATCGPEDAFGAPSDQGGEERLAWLSARADQARDVSYHYLLTLRFALINLIGFALLAAA